MNPNVSANWFDAGFLSIICLVWGVQLWRRWPPGRLALVGSMAVSLALTGVSVSRLYYQGFLDVRAWPTTSIFDQVLVTSTGSVFVMVKDPVLARADRVQRYNCRGELKAAFQPDSAGGLFKIAVNSDDTLSIFSTRTETIDTFSFDGRFLQRHEVDSRRMPFDFLKPGPSVKRANGCEFIMDPVSGRPAVKDSAGTWPLERGDWVLEYILNLRNIIAASAFGALLLFISLARIRNQRAATDA